VDASRSLTNHWFLAMQQMQRRGFLQWLTGLLGAAVCSVVGLPGVKYLLESLGRGRRTARVVQRVARLADLTPGRPLLVAVTARKQDAWTEYPQHVVGRVWLVKSGGDGGVQAFTAVCPHLGCTIQAAADGKTFVCPCHRAAFDAQGRRLPSSATGQENHAPRDMDALACRVVQDEQTGEAWVEVTLEQFVPGLRHKVARG